MLKAYVHIRGRTLNSYKVGERPGFEPDMVSRKSPSHALRLRVVMDGGRNVRHIHAAALWKGHRRLHGPGTLRG